MSEIKLITDTIDKFINEQIKKSPYDKTYNGLIVSVDEHSLYSVLVGGITYSRVSAINGDYSKNQSVKVIVPQGQFNLMYIVGSSTNSSKSNVCWRAEYQHIPSLQNQWIRIGKIPSVSLDINMVNYNGSQIIFKSKGRYRFDCGIKTDSSILTSQSIGVKLQQMKVSTAYEYEEMIVGNGFLPTYVNLQSVILDVDTTDVIELQINQNITSGVYYIDRAYLQIEKVG